MCNVPYNDIHTILRSVTNLEEAIFHSCSWSHHLHGDVLLSNSGIIESPHNDPYESSLTDIMLDISGTAFPPVYLSFFSDITAPNLRSAKLSYAFSGCSNLADQEVLASLHHFPGSFIDMIGRSGSSLTRLTLTSLPLTSTDLPSLFAVSSALRELYLERVWGLTEVLDEDLLEALTLLPPTIGPDPHYEEAPSSTEVLLPTLSKLTIDGFHLLRDETDEDRA
jgi:hypothetical protein